MTSLNMDPRSTAVSQVLVNIETLIDISEWHPVSFVWRSSSRLEHARSVGSRRGVQDPGSFTDIRTDEALAKKILRSTSPVLVFKCWQLVESFFGRMLCVRPVSGDRWIMVSSASVFDWWALQFSCGIAGCRWEANISRGGRVLDQFGLPASFEDLRNWVRQG